MNHDEARLQNSVEELRQAFDFSFAKAIDAKPKRMEDLLTVRVDDVLYALRLGETIGLFADRRIVPIPSSVSEFLGVAGIRGSTIPIYDLRQLLGYARGTIPRWFVLAANAAIGLAFDRFEKHIRLPCEAFAPEERADMAVREIVQTGDAVLPVIHLPSIVAAIEKRVLVVQSVKET